MLYALIILLTIAIILWLMIPVGSKLKEKKHQERLETIARIKPNVEGAFAEIGKYYSFSHYITETERLMLAEKYDTLESLPQK